MLCTLCRCVRAPQCVLWGTSGSAPQHSAMLTNSWPCSPIPCCAPRYMGPQRMVPQHVSVMLCTPVHVLGRTWLCTPCHAPCHTTGHDLTRCCAPQCVFWGTSDCIRGTHSHRHSQVLTLTLTLSHSHSLSLPAAPPRQLLDRDTFSKSDPREWGRGDGVCFKVSGGVLALRCCGGTLGGWGFWGF